VRDIDGDGVDDVLAAEQTDQHDSDVAADNLSVLYLNRREGGVLRFRRRDRSRPIRRASGKGAP
jgi:hypothetical protein